jgi:hypothetical protein
VLFFAAILLRSSGFLRGAPKAKKVVRFAGGRSLVVEESRTVRPLGPVDDKFEMILDKEVVRNNADLEVI